MLEVLELEALLFLLIAVGYLIRKIGVVSAEGQKTLNNLVLYVVLPCNILRAFTSGGTDGLLGEFLEVLLISFGLQAFVYLYGRIVFRKASEDKKASLMFATICSNAGFLGNPVAEELYGASGLLIANIYLIPQRIAMWSIGLAAFTGKGDMKKTLKTVLTHPCIIACVIGIPMMLLGWELPGPIGKTVGAIANCNTALSMMVIGMILTGANLRDIFEKDTLIYCLHRLVIIPLVVYLVCLVFPVSAEVRGVSVILAAMPAGAITSILASKYGRSPEFASKMVVLSTLLSLPTLIIWKLILG